MIRIGIILVSARPVGPAPAGRRGGTPPGSGGLTAKVAAPRPRTREMTALSTAQLARLLASAGGSRWYPLWVLLGTAGLRIGEA